MFTKCLSLMIFNLLSFHPPKEWKWKPKNLLFNNIRFIHNIQSIQCLQIIEISLMLLLSEERGYLRKLNQTLKKYMKSVNLNKSQNKIITNTLRVENEWKNWKKWLKNQRNVEIFCLLSSFSSLFFEGKESKIMKRGKGITQKKDIIIHCLRLCKE